MRAILLVLAAAACSAPAAPARSPEPPGGGGLVLTFEGKEYPITKDPFLIGGDDADLPLAGGDCNLTARVSVVKDPEGYRLKDLESKGFQFQKMTMDNKRIDDGDVFELCNAELRFSLR